MEPPSPDIALKEGAWSRARREGRARCLTLSFLIVEVVLSYLVGSAVHPLVGILAFFAAIGVVFLGSLIAAPVQQRNDARAAVADAKIEQRTREEFELVEKELSIACIEAEAFFVDTWVEQEEATKSWDDWRSKTAEFLCQALGEAAEARFRGAGETHGNLRQWAVRDREQLLQLLEQLTPEKIRLPKREIEAGISKRRENEGLAFIARKAAADENRKKQQEEHAKGES